MGKALHAPRIAHLGHTGDIINNAAERLGGLAAVDILLRHSLQAPICFLACTIFGLTLNRTFLPKSSSAGAPLARTSPRACRIVACTNKTRHKLKGTTTKTHDARKPAAHTQPCELHR